MDLMPNYDFPTSDTTSNHYRSDGESDNKIISNEEEEAFLLSEKEDREKNERENGGKDKIGNIKEENGSINDSKNYSINSDSQNNEEQGRERCSDRIQRNAGLEFSLFLDENSTVDLYLQLISGVKKEKYDDDIIKENSVVLCDNKQMSNYTINNRNNRNNDINDSNNNNNNNNSNDNNNDNNNDNDNDSNTDNDINNENDHDKNKIKKTKFETKSCFDVEENLPKKKKLIGTLSTESLLNLNKINENKINSSETAIANDLSVNKNILYNSKYLDKVTHVRLSGMYEQCKGKNLESLLLSPRMLMLMGYPGHDGEEGT